MIDYIFHPFYGGVPYYELLYGTFDRTIFNIKGGDLDSAFKALEEKGQCVFHQHHLNIFFSKAKDQKEAWRICTDVMDRFDAFQAAGGKIIWTVHNKLSHDSPFTEQEFRLRHNLSVTADIVHLHDAAHIGVLEDILSLASERVVVCQNGNWIGSYGDFNIQTRLDDVANKKAIFVGQLRPYKGLENVIRTITWLDRQGIETMIAGRPFNSLAEAYIKNHAPKRTRLILKYLSDAEIHKVCSEYNIGILSYSRILTSGSLMLYLSYGMNILASQLQPGEGGGIFARSLRYDISDEGLQKLLVASPKELANGARHNYEIAASQKWDDALGKAASKMVETGFIH